MIKIGESAIPQLIKLIESSDGFETQQGIDSLGGISNKTNDKRALPVLLGLLDKYSDNRVTVWKIVRALSGFKFIEAVAPLIKAYQNSLEPSIRWEAIRSIGQIGMATPEVVEVLQRALKDDNAEVRKSSKVAIEHINTTIK